MYSALYEAIPSVQQYLDRMNYTGSTSLDADTLNSLVVTHMCTVPFENLDIFDLHRIPSIATKDLFNKVVLAKRGGFCFELNGVFYSLLKGMGFDVSPRLARIMRGRDFLAPKLHRINIVTIGDKRYYCDVGFGGPAPLGSVLIEEGVEQDLMGETFFFKKTVTDADIWSIYRKHTDGSEELIIQFHDIERDLVDFVVPSYYCATFPEVLFVKSRVINLRTKNGVYSMMNDVLKITEGDVTHEIKLETKEDLIAALEKYYGIVDAI